MDGRAYPTWRAEDTESVAVTGESEITSGCCQCAVSLSDHAAQGDHLSRRRINLGGGMSAVDSRLLLVRGSQQTRCAMRPYLENREKAMPRSRASRRGTCVQVQNERAIHLSLRMIDRTEIHWIAGAGCKSQTGLGDCPCQARRLCTVSIQTDDHRRTNRGIPWYASPAG